MPFRDPAAGSGPGPLQRVDDNRQLHTAKTVPMRRPVTRPSPFRSKDVHDVAAHPEGATLEGIVVALVLLLDEAAEVHEPGFRVAMHAIGQVGDQVFNVTRDKTQAGSPADRPLRRGS